MKCYLCKKRIFIWHSVQPKTVKGICHTNCRLTEYYVREQHRKGSDENN